MSIHERESQPHKVEPRAYKVNLRSFEASAEAIIAQYLIDSGGHAPKKADEIVDQAARDDVLTKYQSSLRRAASAAVRGIDPSSEPYRDDPPEKPENPQPEIHSEAYAAKSNY